MFTETDVKSDGFPGKLSGLVGSDVRVGAHPCYERFVLELKGAGAFPGWWVRYLAPLVLLGDFESVTTWAIGLDHQRPFAVSTLDNPPRVVVDIATS